MTAQQVNTELLETIKFCLSVIEDNGVFDASQINTELLEALKLCLSVIEDNGVFEASEKIAVAKALAAISKAEKTIV